MIDIFTIKFLTRLTTLNTTTKVASGNKTEMQIVRNQFHCHWILKMIRQNEWFSPLLNKVFLGGRLPLESFKICHEAYFEKCVRECGLCLGDGNQHQLLQHWFANNIWKRYAITILNISVLVFVRISLAKIFQNEYRRKKELSLFIKKYLNHSFDNFLGRLGRFVKKMYDFLDRGHAP